MGYLIGQSRDNAEQGALLGFFLGPIGWLATLFLDARPQCEKCFGRLDRRASLCPRCGTPRVVRADDPGQAAVSGTARTIPQQPGVQRCPTCGGMLVGPYPKCPHCASEVFWAGNVPTRTAQEATDERERQEQHAAALAEEESRRAAQDKRLAAERETRRREQEKRWAAEYEERRRQALRRWNQVRCALARRRREVAIASILVIVAGALAATVAVHTHLQACREQEEQRKQRLAQRRRHDRLADRDTRLAVLGIRRSDLDWDKASADSAEIIPENADAVAYRCRGVARCAMGNWGPAIEDFTEAIRRGLIDARSYRLRGVARCAMGTGGRQLWTLLRPSGVTRKTPVLMRFGASPT